MYLRWRPNQPLRYAVGQGCAIRNAVIMRTSRSPSLVGSLGDQIVVWRSDNGREALLIKGRSQPAILGLDRLYYEAAPAGIS